MLTIQFLVGNQSTANSAITQRYRCFSDEERHTLIKQKKNFRICWAGLIKKRQDKNAQDLQQLESKRRDDDMDALFGQEEEMVTV